jgi:hypothetical protein
MGVAAWRHKFLIKKMIRRFVHGRAVRFFVFRFWKGMIAQGRSVKTCRRADLSQGRALSQRCQMAALREA